MGPSFSYQSNIMEFNWDSVNHEIELFCLHHGLAVSKLFAVQLIIEELVTNIIKYGRRTGDEIISIEATVQEEQIELTISDNSPPFNPLETPAPDTGLSAEERNVGGLGLVLVRQKSKTLSYQYVNGANHMKITI